MSAFHNVVGLSDYTVKIVITEKEIRCVIFDDN